MSFYHLHHRAIISVSGDEPLAFLHDILTANLARRSAGEMTQSCLLSPQGRILMEMLVMVADKKDVFIACDDAQKDELAKKLKLYRLRRKIAIELVDDAILVASDEVPSQKTLVTCADNRCADRGYVSVIAKSGASDISFSDNDAYHAKRIADGIPEGAVDLTPNRALILEAGLDLFEAVDFQKGCYIGQEVTARTKYRGLVKRRLVPVKAAKLETGASVSQDDKEVGVILSVAQIGDEMIGLASLKLQAIHDYEAGAILQAQESALSVHIPEHLMPIPAPNKS